MNPETIRQELLENKPEYHFKTIGELEPAMASLVAQLKEKLEAGEYDTLVSDDVGGRIPTLVLRRIIKELDPEKRLNTFFISGGFQARGEQNYHEMVRFFRKNAEKIKKALLVTELIFRGRTMKNMSSALKEGTDEKAELDVAALFQYSPDDAEKLRQELEHKKAHLFVGERDYGKAPGHEEGHIDLHNDARWLGGIEKSKNYGIHPVALAKLMQEEGRILRDEEFYEIFGITKDDSPAKKVERLKDEARSVECSRREKEPLTEEEIERINDDVRNAREYVKTLAGEIARKIWPDIETKS